MSATNSFSHLTLEERRIILTGITNGSSKAAIAQTVGKDKSTIGKEIKLHRTLSHKCKMPLECNNYRKCIFGRKCTLNCPEYSPFKCSRRDRSPGACNGCSNWSHCRFNKYTYSPEDAQMDYRTVLVDSRQGVNLTTSEAKDIADVVGPLLKKGQSPYQIITNHPELGISEKTLYNYIEGDVLHEIAGITVMDLRRQVSRKISKKKSKGYKKRTDRKYLKGRTYKDYKVYLEENPDVTVVQMDTIYNNETNGPFVQTFKFIRTGVLVAIFHDSKTAESMKSGVDLLESILSPELFKKYVHILLTDRGTEFSAADAMEVSVDGTRRTRVFYCDPLQSGQKGSLENKHIELRYIFPKDTDLKALGLIDQAALNIAVSHIDSVPLEKFGGKSPLDVADFMYHDLYKKLDAFGIHKIEKDKVVLKPYLLKK
ncbi:MAG TPA: IS30 family transposase [Candidatus Alectryocaccobium stercorigallinarum]|nr:IS30 family transposase [Candidatus Alectryocaccobium stercorigallinarum]